MSFLDNLLKSVSGAAKKVVGTTVKSGAKAVNLSAKATKDIPGLNKVTGSAAKETSKAADKTVKATDKTFDTVKDAASTATNASVGMTKAQMKAITGAAKAASKGDVKGVAGSALGGVTGIEKGFTDIGKGGAASLGGLVGATGDLTGSRDLSRSGENISREGQNIAEATIAPGMELGAGIMTGGASTAALAGTRALANQGFGAIANPDWKQMGLSMIASETGVPVEALQAGTNLAQGRSVKDAALQGGASYAGVNPEAVRMAQAGAKGDLRGALANATYDGYDMSNLNQAKQLAQGKIDKNAIQKQLVQAGTSRALAEANSNLSPEMQANIQKAQATQQINNIQDTISMRASAPVRDDMNLKNLLGQVSSKGKLQKLMPTDQFTDPSLYTDMIKQDIESQGGLESVINKNQLPNKDIFGTDSLFRSVKDTVGGWFDSSPENSRISTDEAAPQEAEPSIWDKVTGAVGGVVDKARDYNRVNPELLNAGIGTAATAAAFKQKQDALQSQQKILSEQLAQARGMQTYEQQTPELYKQLAQGGPTSAYSQEMMKTARDAGQIAQQGRGAALERMTRMGRGGGELEAMLGGAQEGANRYADTSRQALINDQALRIGAVDKMSNIDQFNVNQRQAGQTQRVNMEQGLRNQEQAYQGQSGNLQAGLTSGIANTAMETNAAIADRAQKAEQAKIDHDRKVQLAQVQYSNQQQAAQPVQNQNQRTNNNVAAQQKQSTNIVQAGMNKAIQNPTIQNAASNIQNKGMQAIGGVVKKIKLPFSN